MTEKEKFLRSEFWMFSWRGSLPRPHKLYGASENDKKKFKGDKIKFRKCLIKFCDNKLLPMYESQDVSESIHCLNIKELKEHANSCCYKHVLEKPYYNIGVAQKLLNLQLKYLWCAGMSQKPPHCPIDGTILEYVGWDGDSWTTWESIFVYKWAINTITEKAHSEGWKHIADWELWFFNNK